MLTGVPFAGLYESIWSQALDRGEEQFAESQAEREADQKWSPDDYQPPHLRISASEYADILYWVSDYSAGRQVIARAYAGAFNNWLSEQIGLPLSLQFESMTSPWEYNFETDRIFCTISQKTVRRLFKISKAENHVRLAAEIKRRFTSCGGFVSFYANELADWLVKPLLTWDCNEVETLLCAVAMLPDDDGCEVYEQLQNDNVFDLAFEAAVDWPKFDEKVKELRDEKQAAYEVDHPEVLEHAPRGPSTPDLFESTPNEQGEK